MTFSQDEIVALMEAKNFTRAEQELRAEIDKGNASEGAATGPDDKRVWLLLGQILDRTDRPGQAIAAYEQYLTFFPNDVSVLTLQANSQLAMENWSDAFKTLQKILWLRPDDLSAGHTLFELLPKVRPTASSCAFLACPSPLRIKVIAAADENYMPFLEHSLTSVLQASAGYAVSFGILDLGLRADQKDRLKALNADIIAPDWKIDFPGRDAQPGHFKAMVNRPFLSELFPGQHLLLWLDADAWVQTGASLDHFLLSALTGALAVTPEVSSAYRTQFRMIQSGRSINSDQEWRYRVLQLAYGPDHAKNLSPHPTLNSGVFALRGDAPHWAAWQQALREALSRTTNPFVEQTALNFAVYHDELDFIALDATHNWQTHLCQPLIDPQSGLFCTPAPPYHPLGIIHVTGPDKSRPRRIRTLNGGAEMRPLLPALPGPGAGS